ncbi:hypothetical protein ACFWIW_39305 [Amycolatopsis sp. NPDC058340]|uniref:hypothetical protein n=1 Tax=Amycolatopsis sp. NPDC058340 TaxID=3346453 RepID=UPI00365A8E60
MKDWTFCPRCGDRTRLDGDGADTHVRCPACGFTKYDNPLPTTVGLVLDGDRILLLRRAHEPRKGGWDTVGGFLSGAETPKRTSSAKGWRRSAANSGPSASPGRIRRSTAKRA